MKWFLKSEQHQVIRWHPYPVEPLLFGLKLSYWYDCEVTSLVKSAHPRRPIKNENHKTNTLARAAFIC